MMLKTIFLSFYYFLSNFECIHNSICHDFKRKKIIMENLKIEINKI